MKHRHNIVAARTALEPDIVEISNTYFAHAAAKLFHYPNEIHDSPRVVSRASRDISYFADISRHSFGVARRLPCVTDIFLGIPLEPSLPPLSVLPVAASWRARSANYRVFGASLLRCHPVDRTRTVSRNVPERSRGRRREEAGGRLFCMCSMNLNTCFI